MQKKGARHTAKHLFIHWEWVYAVFPVSAGLIPDLIWRSGPRSLEVALASAAGSKAPAFLAPYPENGLGGSRRTLGGGVFLGRTRPTVARRSTATLFMPRGAPVGGAC